MPVDTDTDIAGVLGLMAAADQPMSAMAPPQARGAFAAVTAGRRRPEHVIGVRSVEDAIVGGAEGDQDETCAMLAEVLHP